MLVTPTCRRSFDEAGHIRNTHEDYPEAMRWMASRENIPLIELNGMTRTLYEALGIEQSKRAFVHHSCRDLSRTDAHAGRQTPISIPYGAYQIAKCVIRG